MTESYFKRHSRSFFRGKKARLLEERTNLGGQTIASGETVIILGKSDKFFEEALNIVSEADKSIEIHGIDCKVIELIKNSEI